MTVETSHHDVLGIYGISDAARYLSVTLPRLNGQRPDPAKLRYWIRSGASRISEPQFPTTKRLITFQDVISMRMIAILRAKNIPLQKVRDLERWARSQFSTDWPFAFRPMWAYQSDVFIEFEKQLVAATRFGQLAMDILREWLDEIELDMTFDSNQVAATWTPQEGIELDPHIQFGDPCIVGTDIPTKAIWSKTKAGDSVELLASLYEVDLSLISDAIDWERQLAEAA